MKFLKKIFKIGFKIFKTKSKEPRLGGYDLDDSGNSMDDKVYANKKVGKRLRIQEWFPEDDLSKTEAEALKAEQVEKPAEVKKKPGRPKGSTAKKTTAKKTTAKKTTAKKTTAKKTVAKKSSAKKKS